MTAREQALQVVDQQSALSIIEQMNVASVANTMNKIAQFQAVVQKTLKEGHDFGVIPGTQKPTLLKPGAEKILMLMGLTSEYEVTESVRDYEQGFFAFTLTCRLSKNGYPINEGVGHCNTRERRYQGEKQDPYTLANTVLKMAKKRSLVDASLTVASLSDLFTQDLEDMPTGGNGGDHSTPTRSTNGGDHSTPTRSTNGKVATDKQLGFLSKKAKEKGLDAAALDIWVIQQVGKHVDQLSSKEASTIIDALDSYQSSYSQPVTRDSYSADTYNDVPLPDDEM
jgi:hypothetical protein